MTDSLERICGLLNKYEVDYLIVGGVAVIFHGYLRTTADLDVWYQPSLENFNRLIQAFDENGTDVSELHTMVFDPSKAFLRIPMEEFKTDFLPQIPGGLTFVEAKARAQLLRIGNVDIPFIGYEDLIRNKKSTNRLKDLADVEELEKRKKLE